MATVNKRPSGKWQATVRYDAFHPIADHCPAVVCLQTMRGGPSDDTPRIKVQNHGQIEPALTGPDIADINDL